MNFLFVLVILFRYEHARHDPNEFGNEEYEAYHRLLLKLIDA